MMRRKGRAMHPARHCQLTMSSDIIGGKNETVKRLFRYWIMCQFYDNESKRMAWRGPGWCDRSSQPSLSIDNSRLTVSFLPPMMSDDIVS